MREILFKDLTGADHRKHDLCIREVITRNDFMATVERRCIYFVRDCVYVDNPAVMSKFECINGNNDVWKKKHFHILRNHDSKTGDDKLVCKIAGTLYAVAGHYVFCIAFIHSFKIDLTQPLINGNKV